MRLAAIENRLSPSRKRTLQCCAGRSMSFKPLEARWHVLRLFRLGVREVVLGLCLCIAPASAITSQSGPANCALPDPPACIDKSSTYDDSRAILDCKTDITNYIASVEAYRTCLESGATRAILEANKLIDLFKAKMTAKPTPLAPRSVSHVSGRPLRLNGSSGQLQFSFRDSVLRIEKLTLAGKVISDPARSCEISVVSEAPLEASSLGHPDGLARYKADFPACSFSFDVVDGAVLLPLQSSDCVFQAADCEANPGGLWGPEATDLSRNADIYKREVSRAEAQMNLYIGGLSAGVKDVKRLDGLKKEQADFLSRRSQVCSRYDDESVHGFCSLQITLARAAFLKARLEALPDAPARNPKR